MHTSADINRGSPADLGAGEVRLRIWPVMIVTVVAGLVGMHLVVVKPLQRHIADLERELIVVQRDMARLAGTRGQIREANTLLAALNEQGRQLADAGRALHTIRRLRTDLQSEAANVEQAAVLLDRLAGLEQSLLRQEPQIIAAGRIVERMARLQTRLLDEGCTADEADEALAGLIGLKQRAIGELTDMEFADVGLQALSEMKRQLVRESADVYDARAALDELVFLKEEVIRGGNVETALDSTRRLIALRDDLAVAGEGFDAAERNVAEFSRLKDQLNSNGSGVETAQRVADDLLVLKDEIVLRGSNTETARNNARRLISLRDELNVDRAGLEAAERNLGALLGIQSKLADRSDDLVSAVQSLELLIDFRDEIDGHVRSLDGIRRNLMEIALLETSMVRAARVLEPLAELANLRRLGEADIREVARTILEQRATRLSQLDERVLGAAAESVAAPTPSGRAAGIARHGLVPDPIDEE